MDSLHKDQIISLKRGDYLLDSPLPGQQASFGELWLARDKGSGQRLVLKFVRQGLAEEDSALRAAHLQEEIRFFEAMEQHPSPHVVTMLDHGSHGGQPVLALEYLHGNLEHWLLGHSAPTLWMILDWCRQIALGLAAVHALGKHHRDLKLSNILCDARATRLKLADFGTSRNLTLDQAHSFAGTPLTMAPEQALPAAQEGGCYFYETDHRSDFYALGLILYRLVTGVYPQSQQQIQQLRQQQGEQAALDAFGHMGGVSNEELTRFENRLGDLADPDATIVPGASRRPPGMARALVGLLKSLLAVRKEDRPDDAQAILRQLEALLGELPAPEPRQAVNTTPWPETEIPTPRPSRPWKLAAGAGLLGLSLGGVWWLSLESPAPPTPLEKKEWSLDEGLVLHPAESLPSESPDTSLAVVEDSNAQAARRASSIEVSATATTPAPTAKPQNKTAPRIAPSPTTDKADIPESAPLPPAAGASATASLPTPTAKPRNKTVPRIAPSPTTDKAEIPEPVTLPPTHPRPDPAPVVKTIEVKKTPPRREKQEATLRLDNLPISLVQVPGGSFIMGNNAGPEDEQPEHTVRVRRFLMMAQPVSVGLFQSYCQASGASCPATSAEKARLPVNRVSRENARAFARWVSQLSGRHCRLPSEAEWEYAARNSPVVNTHHLLALDDLPANDLGLAGLLGNQWEWVADCAHASYAQAPDDGRAWGRENGGNCNYAVARGGSWFDAMKDRNATNRLFTSATRGLAHVGFRLVCEEGF